MSVAPGDVLAGKYQVERVLGQGGMGVVVAAHHVHLDTKVAIKFLLPEMLSNAEAVARFAREARAAVKITSEHVARVLDVGTLESGAPYMVMEFLEGGDLAAWIKQRGPLPIEQAVEFVLHACVAVAEAHGLGIVHRDLKPANLFCIRRPDGQLSIKVLDFGISKVASTLGGTDPAALSMTKTSAVMGSPLYMSPEQMHSAKSADAQSDIWALGVILYELLAGRVPFDGETATEVAAKVVMRPPPSLRGLRPEVPPALEAVVMRCLEKERASRTRNVADLALALAPFAPARARASIERITGTIQAAGLSSDAPPARPAGAVPGATAVQGTSVSLSNTAAGLPGRRTGLVLGTAIGVLVLAGAALALVGLRGGAKSAAAPALSATAAPAASSPEPVVLAPPAESESAPAPAPAPAPASAHAPSHAPGTARPTTPQGKPGADCDPPYTIDDQGRKHFKPECFLQK